MSYEKPITETMDSQRTKRPRDADVTPPGAKKPVRVLSLSIDENDDFGGDPYNHTGSFCVPKFRD